MKQFLTISILGEDSPGILHAISELTTAHGCSIETSRMTSLQQQFGMLLLISGDWSCLAKLEANLPALANKYKLNVDFHRTQAKENNKALLPYAVELIAAEKPGIINEITSLFSEQGINITDLRTDTYTSVTGANMFTLSMKIYISQELQIAELREQLMLICEEYNLDAILEPEKI
ncbi:MAG: glycine cleavage system protein R [Legionellales bacterium]|nr:glycine cleavage system protein R [Legionellales bacterium]|tara:strand:- start:7260 stop:7787 length:528 start_codon:yes stop_codon:yes gene_type:complete